MKRTASESDLRALRELTLLHEISGILDRSLDIRDVVSPVLKALADHMAMRHGTITLLNRKTGDILIEAAHGLSKEQIRRGRYRLGEGVTGEVILTGKPAVVPRISESPVFLNRTHVGKQREDASFICVPIKIGKECIGALSADRLFDPDILLDEDLRLLSIVASMIAQAVKLRRMAQEERERLEAENERLRLELRDRFRPSNIIGNSREIRLVYDQIAQVGRTATSILIVGESGTGKELVANAIHYNSDRASQPFIKVHCAALPETVIESELFGHEKGAFTGAVSARKGRFELADGGTLFLDEVADIPASIQVKLLRVLQEREFERLGGTQTLKVNVRLICATNQDLQQLTDRKKFREDLYYRINVFPIFVPPLRNRKTDIVLLADHFLEKYARAAGKAIKRISSAAIDMLMSYHWPGNVRELENCLERAVLVAAEDVIYPHHLPPTLQTAEASGTGVSGTLEELVQAYEKDIVQDALKSTRGNMAAAARMLSTTERIIRYKVRNSRIDPKKYR
ncbi:MAG: sigma 54-interacting transcriptional regulator [Kiritimatiellae bacterium]|nr:sigma 54-interacting transcriptional regulator [Kiritimatiellia bacterium]